MGSGGWHSRCGQGTTAFRWPAAPGHRAHEALDTQGVGPVGGGRGGLDTPKAGLASEAARSGEPCLPCSRLADLVGKILRFLDRSASQGSVHSRRTLDAHRIMGSV